MKACVFGLGEAGALFGSDLAVAGVEVTGFDPRPVATPGGVTRFDDPRAAVVGADLVLALTAQDDALGALAQALDRIPDSALYADLSTSAPAVKRTLAGTCAGRHLAFVDVALMSPVPGKGLRTPALTSGDGADRYVSLLAPLGAPVSAVGPEPGEAATRKLLRSVMMKGLAALVIEAMRAAEQVDRAEWLWGNLVEEITGADETLLRRLVEGTGPHAVRRLHEMEACQSLLESIGVEPTMTRSTVASLAGIPTMGVPDLPR